MAEFLHGDLRKYIFTITEFKGKKYINLRLWQRYDPRNEADWRPTKKGLFIPLFLAKEFIKAINEFLLDSNFKGC